jgi:hypothetical protein
MLKATSCQVFVMKSSFRAPGSTGSRDESSPSAPSFFSGVGVIGITDPDSSRGIAGGGGRGVSKPRGESLGGWENSGYRSRISSLIA